MEKKKFKVTARATVQFKTIVEADDDEGALEEAKSRENMFDQNLDPDEDATEEWVFDRVIEDVSEDDSMCTSEIDDDEDEGE